MMERITSCESTLSELVTISSDFSIGDRVRRIAGAGVATATCSADTAGTVRFVGPMNVVNTTTNQKHTNTVASTVSPCSPVTTASPTTTSPPMTSSPTTTIPPSISQTSLFSGGNNNNNATSNAGPVYIGVEWDMPVGKNDGSVEGVRYFTCQPGYGSLVLPKVLSKGLPLATLLEARYGSSTVRQEAGTVTTESAERNTQTRPLQLGPAIGYRDPDTGAFIKVVNCDCTANEQLGLASTAGGTKLGNLFPNLHDLSVAGTLLASWDEVRLIGASLPNLAALDLSRNPALGAPTSSKHNKNKNNINNNSNSTNDDETNATASTIVISSSIQELRMSDMGLMTPDCIDFVFAAFPSLKSLFVARNNLTLKGHSKKGLTKGKRKQLVSANAMNSPTSAATSNNNSNNNDTVPSGENTLTSTSNDKNALSISIVSSSSSALTYLNIEGNEGIDCLEDVADLIGSERCQSLTALNVSATSISDAPHLPPIDPDAVVAAFANKASSSSPSSGNNNNNNNNNNASPMSNSTSSTSSTNPSTDLANAPLLSNSSSSNSPSKSSNNNASVSSLYFPPLPPPLFPKLVSLYMSKTPIRSWLALSRVMHLAANCLNILQDVHFSTTASDLVDQEQQQQEHDDGLSTVADDDIVMRAEDSSEVASTVSVAGCFLPEDFRDRRRLSVAFMPPNVKKFNRSEITSVERSSAITRSIPVFHQLVKRTEMKNADDPEQAEEVEIVDPKRLGDLPRHLHRQVVNEHNRSTTRTANNAGVGFIYRPSSLGPKKMVNEFEINVRCVFISSKDQYSNLRGEFFRSVLSKIKEEEEEAKHHHHHHDDNEDNHDAVITTSTSNTSQQQQQQQQEGCEKDLKRRNNAFGKVKMMVDVRWETKQLEAAVRDALGMNSPTASLSADPTTTTTHSNSNKITPINLFHIDRELMENPGAVAQGLHCKYLSRPWEKLHMSKIAENDDIIACVGP